MPSSLQALKILIAISPLFATRIFLNFFIIYPPYVTTVLKFIITPPPRLRLSAL